MKYFRLVTRASAENFLGGGERKKYRKLAKNRLPKTALFSLFQGGGGRGAMEKTRKIAKND